MVDSLLNPLNIIVVTLGVSFLLPLVHQKSAQHAVTLTFASLGFFVLIALTAFIQISSGAAAIEIYTAGFKPPFSINLHFGLEEAFVCAAVNIAGLMGGWFLLERLRTQASLLILFIIWIMGINGMIMTRDLFNLFIFIEITAISSFIMVSFKQTSDSLSAGFKYMIAGAVASAFFLLGTMLIYLLTGSLNIDDLATQQSQIANPIGLVALVFVISAILIELKPYPANGWGLDVYQAAPAGVAAIVSVGVSAGFLFALYKLLPLLDAFLPVLAVTGIITFVLSNFIALKQTEASRLLGYSSVGQVGLVITALALLSQTGETALIGVVAGGLFISHFFAKAGLFWLAGVCQQKNITQWSALKQSPVLFISFVLLLSALAGFPPFPSFWAKWSLIHALANHEYIGWIVLILLGSLLEIAFLFRWFGYAQHKSPPRESIHPTMAKTAPSVVFTLLLFVTGYVMATEMGIKASHLLPVYLAFILLLLSSIPGYVQAIMSMLIVGVYSLNILPTLSGLHWLFGLMFLVGSWILLIANFYKTEEPKAGYYPLLVMLILSLGTLLTADTTLAFFLAWEFMTISSYFLISLGDDAEKPSLQYLVFSLAAAFFILCGFALAYSDTNSFELSALGQISDNSTAVISLLVMGFLIKLGGFGAHIWLPGSYAESSDDFTPLLSGVVSKAGVFGLFMAGSLLTPNFTNHETLMEILGWFGLIMATAGALMAVFQEDIKLVLAYSSIGQMGYIITGFALTSHLGWVTATYLAMNHFLYKALIFLAIAGVVYRLNTRLMYQMGGIVKNMPVSFFAVMIGIIALSGVPPLLGFGGKWLLYNAMVEKGWYLQTGLAFFASAIAFLYLFRLIHTIFLGQRKAEHHDIKEAPISLLIPQIILIIAILALSLFPQWIIQPISEAVSPYFAATLHWQGSTVSTTQGYWNGSLVMYIVAGVFLVPALLLWLLSRVNRVQKVEQFNIVFAAERPESPETTHYAYNFYAFYEKALGFLVTPKAIQFWQASSEWAHTLGSVFRRLYTGNGQTYMAIMLLYTGLIYLTVSVV